LSPRAVRELTFDLERLFVSDSPRSEGDHVFISGLARSGTTALLNAIFSTEVFASLSYADMPFVLAPNLWSRINRGSKHQEASERAHGDGILVSTDSPEAFEEVFWNTFEDDEAESRSKFEAFVDSVLTRYQRERYLSKNNQNHQRLNLIADIFPNSVILVPFRDPSQHAMSLVTQHAKFVEQSDSDPFVGRYMTLIGHTEFGPGYDPLFKDGLRFSDCFDINHWLEQWLLFYQKLRDELRSVENAHLVCYESLCASDDCWKRIQSLIGVDNSDNSAVFSSSVKSIPHDIDAAILSECEALYRTLQSQAI
jgi:hypothetical protein